MTSPGRHGQTIQYSARLETNLDLSDTRMKKQVQNKDILTYLLYAKYDHKSGSNPLEGRSETACPHRQRFGNNNSKELRGIRRNTAIAEVFLSRGEGNRGSQNENAASVFDLYGDNRRKPEAPIFIRRNVPVVVEIWSVFSRSKPRTEPAVAVMGQGRPRTSDMASGEPLAREL